MKVCREITALVVAVALPLSVLADKPSAQIELPTVEIKATTPLPGIGIPFNQVPANVQVFGSKQIDSERALDLAEFLDQNLGSVSTNGGQANPFQSSVNFRGLSASPVLGTPQGMSVFFDGVRVNEPFGDTVNWDLIPQSAIANIAVVPGSNPIFGLNTLGGALVIHTKSGFQFPGFTARAQTGSFGRNRMEFELGGHGAHVDYFVTANGLSESGWREHSPSRVQQLFAKAGYEDGDTDVDVSFTGADNALEGVQALPLSMLDNPRQAYTWPDRTDNRLRFLNVRASRLVGSDHLVAANLYYRSVRSSNFSSNINDNFDPTGPVGAGNSQGFNDFSVVDQGAYGGSAQWTYTGKVAGHGNQLTLGLSLDGNRTDFTRSSQEANFTPDRGSAGAGPLVIDTDAGSTSRYYGFYFTDSLTMDERWHLSLAGRYNRANVKISDRTGTSPGLNGEHGFGRFNPALGIAYNPTSTLTAYASYSEGMRVPTPVELTCADPAAPCKLPNSFLADPPLKPVIAKTWEGGLRGNRGASARWSAALFRTDLSDDIQFVSSGGAINAGFFQNVGTTRREGIELGVSSRHGALEWAAGYSLINAIFASPLTIHSPNNSGSNAGGDIQVTPGNRIPGISRHGLKARIGYDFSPSFSVGVSIVGASSQFALGDENNRDRHGAVPGYGVVNLDARWKIERGWEAFARVNNLFDKKYETFGTLGQNFFTGPGNTFDAAGAAPEQFRSPGMPHGLWVGVRYVTEPKGKND